MSLQDKLKAMLGDRAAAGNKFLEENAQREGVVVLPSGLQYEILQEGSGEQPGSRSMVTVHYEGRLADGTVFDSSYQREKPATFGVHQVIPGWTEALQLMPLGSKWRVFIPQELGYGARGAGGSIPPYAALVFDVALLGISG